AHQRGDCRSLAWRFRSGRFIDPYRRRLKSWRRLRRCSGRSRRILSDLADQRARDRLSNQIRQSRRVHRAAGVRAIDVRAERQRPRRWRKNHRHRMKALRKIFRPLLLMCAFVSAIWIALPKPPLLEKIPFSQIVRDRNGKLLRVTLSSDQKFRIWTPLSNISPDLIDATLRYEDKYYSKHPGVNPIALARCVINLARFHRATAGGSTITMQVARL